MKRWMLLAALIPVLLMLTACRVRTTAAPGPTGTGTVQTADRQTAAGEGPGSQTGDAATAEDGSGRTAEDPDARNRAYDEDAAAEVSAGAEHVIQAPGEGEGAPQAQDGSGGAKADQLRDTAGRTATQVIPVGESDRLGAAEDAEDADSVLLYYTVLLQDRLGQLFECHRLNVYWETAQEGRTIHKSDPDHLLILQAGCYDVSARLLEENLTVDAGWVRRKDPGVVVKIVDKGVLGFGVMETGAAAARRDALCSRPDWDGMDAVRSGRVVLLSEQLLTGPAMRTGAALIVARTAYPDLFADVDPEEALRALIREESGVETEGVLFLAE